MTICITIPYQLVNSSLVSLSKRMAIRSIEGNSLNLVFSMKPDSTPLH